MAFDESESSLSSKSLPAISQSDQSQPPTVDNDNRLPFFPIFRLPLELRRMIYFHHAAMSRLPTGSDVHQCNLAVVWKDIPSPLLGTCRQTRDEVLDLLRHFPVFTSRVTTFGVAFDMLSLSCLIAQKRPKRYIGLPGLHIDIWPPDHNKNRRRIDMLRLWMHLQQLLNKLRAGPQIPKVRICFRENELAKWSEENQPRKTLKVDDIGDRNDMELVLDLFSRITNVDKVVILLPRSLQSHAYTRLYARAVRTRMRRGFLKPDLDIYNLDIRLKSEGISRSVLDDPFIETTQGLETQFLQEILLDKTDPLAIDMKRALSVWYYSDSSAFRWRFSRLSDFQNNKICRYHGPGFDVNDCELAIEQLCRCQWTEEEHETTL